MPLVIGSCTSSYNHQLCSECLLDTANVKQDICLHTHAGCSSMAHHQLKKTSSLEAQCILSMSLIFCKASRGAQLGLTLSGHSGETFLKPSRPVLMASCALHIAQLCFSIWRASCSCFQYAPCIFTPVPCDTWGPHRTTNIQVKHSAQGALHLALGPCSISFLDQGHRGLCMPCLVMAVWVIFQGMQHTAWL